VGRTQVFRESKNLREKKKTRKKNPSKKGKERKGLNQKIRPVGGTGGRTWGGGGHLRKPHKKPGAQRRRHNTRPGGSCCENHKLPRTVQKNSGETQVAKDLDTQMHVGKTKLGEVLCPHKTSKRTGSSASNKGNSGGGNLPKKLKGQRPANKCRVKRCR